MRGTDTGVTDIETTTAPAATAVRPSQRILYWFGRLVRADLGNMLRLARQISVRFRRPLPVIVADMAWCAARYNAGYYDYHEFEYHLLNAAERRTYLTRPEANHLTRALNPASHRHLLADKVEFNRRFGPWIGREWLDVRDCSPADLRSFVERHGRVMRKASGAVAGSGVEPIDAADVADWAALRAELIASGCHLVEEFLVQHPDMARLHPASVNTLRIVTYLDDDRVHLLAHVVKAGNGQPVDNFGRRGMYTSVDRSGVAHYPAFDKAGDVHPTHPITGVQFDGFRVPLWDEVLDLVDELARVVPELPYVGWDIAITPRGPVVVEGNYNTGVFQMKPSLTNIKRGLVPHYRSIIGDRWPR